ncbi:MAG: hypothetical protein UV24_C0009G0020 [Candidatus Nomurabacteria bacterium GW2011_GWA2_42_41]|nr:MAG: hypothetical protein UV24_C0009G0020 [Candidatus Nomurabacteria bacterium GW2011_GWA2_42_41]
MKRFLASIVITAFVIGAFFSIFAMYHNQGLLMNSDCPTSPLHAEVCPTGDLSVASHYILMYQALTNSLVSSMVTQLLIITLLFVAVPYVFRKYIALIRCLLVSLFILSRDFVPKLYRPQALTRWLSLLVNSPSII